VSSVELVSEVAPVRLSVEAFLAAVSSARYASQSVEELLLTEEMLIVPALSLPLLDEKIAFR
jgi:hypothetical protein